MDEFARSKQGQTFLNRTLPDLVDALNRMASAVEESNRIRSAEIEAKAKEEKPPCKPDAIRLSPENYRYLKEEVSLEKPSKIRIIKALRDVTGWNLKMAKDFTDRYYREHGRGEGFFDPKGFLMNFTEEG
jgi:ribosomal protein L7/L12